MVEDLNRVAKIAFDGQTETLAQFNKDVLNRARKSAATESAADTATSGTNAN